MIWKRFTTTGLEPQFDPRDLTPLRFQPPVGQGCRKFPTDADDALEFWTDDANQALSLTTRPHETSGTRLINARLRWV